MQKLTKYECTRIIGLRSLEIQNGSSHLVNDVTDRKLLMDSTYIAALELKRGLLDFKLNRRYPFNKMEQISGKDFVVHKDVLVLITTKEQNT